MKTHFLFYISLFYSSFIFGQNGLIGEYYDGKNFDKKVFERTDKKINFDWGFNGPGKKIQSENFSIRWKGKIYVPASGDYLFSVKVDDGIRLWIDNQIVIDAWGLHDAASFSNTVKLSGPSHHDIRIEYYNGMLNALCKLYWKRSDKKSILDSFWDNTEVVGEDFFSHWDEPKNEIKKEPATPKPVAAKIDKPKVVKSKTEKPKVEKPVIVEAPKPAIITVEEKKELTMKAKKELEPKFIYFTKGKNEILLTSQKMLDEWVVYLEKMPSTTVTINGYTDVIGDEKMNNDLSLQRAKLVQEYLIKKGISDKRLMTNGLGGTNPVFKNPKLEQERVLNRRVEIKVNE